jgi:hypothetical protein
VAGDDGTGAVLERLEAGQPVVFGGNRVTHVTPELAAAFAPGDRLLVVQETGDLLHVPAREHRAAVTAVDAAVDAFAALAACTDAQITEFFEAFATRLADDAVTAPIRAANDADVAAAVAAGRSTTRLELSPGMRDDMVAGLRSWRDAPGGRDAELARIEHEGWTVAARKAPLGPVGFVFEGRPNVFADATGVLRTGNTVVMRIGSDALGTAEAIVSEALAPALQVTGPRRRVGPLRRSPAGPRRGSRLGGSGGPARCRGPPGRHAGQPARHRWRVARRRERGRPRAVPCRGGALPRPQGVQHAERVLHPGGADRAGRRVPRRPRRSRCRTGRGGPPARRGVLP